MQCCALPITDSLEIDNTLMTYVVTQANRNVYCNLWDSFFVLYLSSHDIDQYIEIQHTLSPLSFCNHFKVDTNYLRKGKVQTLKMIVQVKFVLLQRPREVCLTWYLTYIKITLKYLNKKPLSYSPHSALQSAVTWRMKRGKGRKISVDTVQRNKLKLK